MCRIILCGTRQRKKRQRKISPELQRVLNTKPIFHCPNCNATRDPIVYRYNTWFTLYFIPIFRVRKGAEAACCAVCQTQLQVGNAQNVCGTCGRWNQQHGGFCPSCGTPIGGSRVNTGT